MNFRWWAVASSTAVSSWPSKPSARASPEAGQGFAPLGAGDMAVAVGQEHGVHDLLFADVDHGHAAGPGPAVILLRQADHPGHGHGVADHGGLGHGLGCTVTGTKTRLALSGSR